MTDPGEQLPISGSRVQNLKLFSDYFLEQRLPDLAEYRDAEIEPLMTTLAELWHHESTRLADANESQTEELLIKPALRALGFSYVVQPSLPVATGRRQPDYALFTDGTERDAAAELEGAAVYSSAVAVADAKRFDRPLRGRVRGEARSEDPEAQIIHYVSVTKCPWGVLTNGRSWRLYAAAGDLVEGACYEADLVALLEAGDAGAFRRFACFFRAESFRPGADGLAFLDRVLDESSSAAEAVGDALERQVFAAMPRIAQGLLGDDEPTRDALDAAFENGLVLLYRLLFCLHAEARGLLPIDNPHYRDYSLRKLRLELAEEIDRGRVFSRNSDDLYNDLRALFRIVDAGDDDLGVNQYDGGLFSAANHPYFAGRGVPDLLLASALDELFRIGGHQVDYRDLSIRHLGTIYERLLAYQLAVGDDGELVLEDSARRKYTGSYFTPRPVVDRIVERTLEPLLERRSREIRDSGIAGDDALERFLDLKVLDPAMGSAHFLVSATGYIAQYIATDPAYGGGLGLVEIQRRVAERCIFGVDLIPMAAELASLSIWLTTVKGDEPLTFLSNLRVGNSLVGAELDELLAGGGSVFSAQLARDAAAILERVEEMAMRASASGREVEEKERLFAAAEELRDPLEELADETIPANLLEDSHPAFHWELEFPEVFLEPSGRPRPDGGFDAVIGNPPYIRIQELGRAFADYCRDRYDVARGSFDVYMVFIERAIRLLSPRGRLGFIVPNKFTKLDSGRRLREWLGEEGLLEELIDFADAQVFAGATNYTCILVADRAGTAALDFRRLPKGGVALREALLAPESLPPVTVQHAELGAGPWLLVGSEEQRVVDALRDGAIALGEVTESIFTGLQTSADPIYIVEDRGWRGGRRLVYSRASERVLELEPDLLHPLASGVDVDAYAFRPLDSQLIFPYLRQSGEMRLMTTAELERMPLTWSYLREHEEVLRGRERRSMDHEGWYAFGRTQSLGNHDVPKLGVAATVPRLEVAADPEGGIFFHNVRVNGILVDEGGPSIWTLLVLLNSRALDWIFRRGAAVHANGYFAANRQFVAPLPIQVPDTRETASFDDLGRRLFEAAASIGRERHGFGDWLGSVIGMPVDSLAGHTTLLTYEERDMAELLAILRRNRARLSRDPDNRDFVETFGREHAASSERVGDANAVLRQLEREADDRVYELYRLAAAERALIEAEYSS